MDDEIFGNLGVAPWGGNNNRLNGNIVPYSSGSSYGPSVADLNMPGYGQQFSTNIGSLGPGGSDGSGGGGMSTFGKLGVLAQGVGAAGGFMSGLAALKGIGESARQNKVQEKVWWENLAQAKLAAQARYTQGNNDIGTKKHFIAKTHANPDSSHLKFLKTDASVYG